MKIKRCIATFGAAGVLAAGLVPATASAGQHWTKKQCHEYKVLAQDFRIPKHTQHKTLKQHGCLKHKRH